MNRTGPAGRIAKLLLITTGLLVAAELGARAYLLLRGIPAGRYISATAAIRTAGGASSAGFDTEYPYLPFRPAAGGIGGLPADSLGFMGPETGWVPPPGAFRVLFTGGSMVYDGIFPAAADSCLDILLADGATGFDSCQGLISSGPTWTSAEILTYYAARGVQAAPHALVVYVAVNDVYAMSRPDSILAEPDYSHYRMRWMPPRPAPWDRVPGWADSSRAVALARYALDRLFRPGFLESPPGRLGLRYSFDTSQVIDRTFGTFRADLEALVAIAESRGTRVFLVSELHDPARSGSPAMAAEVAVLNTITGEIAARHAGSGLVRLVDAASILPADSVTLSDKSHLTTRGGVLLGRLIAGEILDSLQSGSQAGRSGAAE